MAVMTPMRARIARGAQPITIPSSTPAPVKGWNARDELDAMDPLDAITLDNWFPDVTGVTVRSGFTQFASGLGTKPVETLAEWRSGASAKFLGACDTSIFDITAGGAVGAALGTGFTNARWQTTNFLGRLFLANGVDTMQTYNGTSLANSVFTGVTLSTIIGCHQYQQRLFFWQAVSGANTSNGFWFAPLNSITGALSFYDLSPFSPRGANLISITTITHDGGNGVLDFIAFIMSTGDMLLYFGNDPAQISAWQFIGRYRVSPPVNIRAICSYGADSFVTTYDDYMPIQQQLVALKLGQLQPRSKVSGAVQAAIIANKSAFGWQALYYPKGRRLIFNVPNVDGTFDQHVCNTGLPDQPWCRFKGMNASTWGLFGDTLYFGGAGGFVYQADNGFEDNNVEIYATAQQAWNKLNSPTRKRMTAVRPIVQSNQGTYEFDVAFDYEAFNTTTPIALSGPILTDDAGVAITDDSNVPITIGVSGINTSWRVGADSGTAVGFQLKTCSIAQTSWLRTDYRLEPGIGL